MTNTLEFNYFQSIDFNSGATRLMTKAVAVELARKGYNIRVNSIHPGMVLTPMLMKAVPTQEARDAMKSLQPLGRIGLPEDIAYGAVYLASDESSFVTGSELHIDGGWFAQ